MDGPKLTCWFPHSGGHHDLSNRSPNSPANVTPPRPIGERARKIVVVYETAPADREPILDESGHAGYGHPEVS
jgi:hypothetical protein